MAVDPETGYKLCKRGHVRSPENVTTNRQCRLCPRVWQRERQRNDPEYAERERATARERKREKYHAEPEYAERERARARERMRAVRAAQILADPAIQEYLRLQNPLTKKLEAMIADAGASQGEKDNAYRILERKGLLPAPTNRRLTWLRRQTTFGAMPNTQHETKSLQRSASS